MATTWRSMRPIRRTVTGLADTRSAGSERRHALRHAATNHVGSHTFTLRVRDRDVGGYSTSQDFTVTVNNVNDAPVVTTASLPAGTQGVAYNTNLTASDADSGQTLTFAATGLPPGLTVTSAGGLGTISGTPTSAGTFQVAVTANDGLVNSAPVNLQLSVAAPGNQNPTITTPPAQSATVGTAFGPLTVTASDPDSDPLTFSATGLPPGLAISATGVISGIPTDNAGSPFTVNVTVNDGRGGTASATFQLTVQPAGTPPPPPPANQARRSPLRARSRQRSARPSAP